MSSGTEAALFSVPYGQVLTAVAEKRRGARALLRIKDDMARPITTIVIWNNIANIVGSMVVGFLAGKLLASHWLGFISAAFTLLVIVFSEIIPKNVGECHALRIGLLVAPAVLWLTRGLHPMILLVEQVTHPFLSPRQVSTSEEEIKALTRLGGEEGVIEADERDLIQRVFRLNDVNAGDIMTPLSRVDYLTGDQRLGELRPWLAEVTHSRIPVFDADDVHHVEGVVQVRDLLHALADGREQHTVLSLADEVRFVPRSMKADDLLRHFQEIQQHLAVVVDGLGAVLGVVTLEDVLEELVGEIDDETDPAARELEVLDAHTLRVDAVAELEIINRHLPSPIPGRGRIGERVLSQLGRIPHTGERLRLGPYVAIVESATPRHVETLIIKVEGNRLRDVAKRAADQAADPEQE